MEFKYKAIDKTGASVSGRLAAESELEAVDQLRQRQLLPVKLAAQPMATNKGSATPRAIKRRISKAQLALTLGEIATLLTAGVGLVEAIENLAHAHRLDPLGNAFLTLGKKLLAGEPFSQAFAQLGLDFPDYVILLARAGEMTGKLGQSIQDAADQMEYEEQVRQEARNALVYPSILVFTGLASVTMIFLVVVPKFASLLNNPRAKIPDISVWVLKSGLFFRDNLLAITIILAVLGVGVVSFMSKPENRQRILELCVNVPVVGDWIESMTVARWSSVFSVLIENRVAIIDAMEQARASSQLSGFAHRLELAQRDIKAGKRLADALELHRVLDPTSISMIRVGERSGELAHMLKTVSSYWTGINRNRVKRLLSLLEPITILIIGVAIGIIMVAIMLAIASLSNLTT